MDTLLTLAVILTLLVDQHKRTKGPKTIEMERQTKRKRFFFFPLTCFFFLSLGPFLCFVGKMREEEEEKQDVVEV